jgi:hypothetical protein
MINALNTLKLLQQLKIQGLGFKRKWYIKLLYSPWILWTRHSLWTAGQFTPAWLCGKQNEKYFNFECVDNFESLILKRIVVYFNIIIKIYLNFLEFIF